MEIVPKIQRILGVVTILALIALAVASWSQLSKDPPGRRFVIYFEESVGGLSKGAKVTYNGIEVGFVEAIEAVPGGSHAGTTAVVIVIRQEFTGSDVPGRIAVRGEPEESNRHPWVSWLDEGLAPRRADERLQKYDWVLAVNQTEVKTASEIDARVRQALAANPELAGQVLFRLRIARPNGAPDAWEERVVPVRSREVFYSFSEGGSRASMTQNLVTGIKHIELVGGHPQLPEIEGVSSSEPLSLESLEANQIFTIETGFARLARMVEKKLPSILENLDAVTANLSELTRDLRGQTDTLDAILHNVKELTDPSSEIGTVLTEGSRALESARRSLERIESEMSTGGHFHEILSNLERLLSKEGEIALALADFRKVMTRVDEQFQSTGEFVQTLDEAKAALGEIKRTVAAIGDSLGEEGEVTKTLEGVQGTLTKVQDSLTGTGRVGATLDELRYSIRHDLRPLMDRLSETMLVLEESMARFNANPGIISSRANPDD